MEYIPCEVCLQYSFGPLKIVNLQNSLHGNKSEISKIILDYLLISTICNKEEQGTAKAPEVY